MLQFVPRKELFIMILNLEKDLSISDFYFVQKDVWVLSSHFCDF